MNDILNRESFSIIRFNAELEYSSQRISGSVNQKIKTQAYTNAGVYPLNDESQLNIFHEENLKSFKNADTFLIGEEFKDFERNIINHTNPDLQVRKASDLINCDLAKKINKKKILIVSPFKKTIDKQIKKNNHIFTENQIITYKAAQAIAGNTPHTCFEESLSIMKQDIGSMDFDLALLSCGGYAIPLCNFIKNLNKGAIYIGGELQRFFFIRGRRWAKQSFSFTNAGFEVTFEDFNEDAKWTNLSDSEYPKNWESIEAGAYWYK